MTGSTEGGHKSEKFKIEGNINRSGSSKKSYMPDATVVVRLEAEGIRTEDEKLRHLGTG